MSTPRHNAVLSAMAALLLLSTTGQSATQTTGSPDALTSRRTTQPNSSTQEPRLLPFSRPCGTKDKDFCKNGGECNYPRDSDKPSCICQSSYTGERCMYIDGRTYSLPEWEQVIGITFGVSVLVLVLACIIYCLASRRCIKSAPFKQISPA